MPDRFCAGQPLLSRLATLRDCPVTIIGIAVIAHQTLVRSFKPKAFRRLSPFHSIIRNLCYYLAAVKELIGLWYK